MPDTDTTPESTDRAGIIAPPPLIFLMAVVTGIALQWYWPLLALPGPTWAAGGVLVLSGLALGMICIRCMRQADTSPDPYSGTTALVAHGPYRFSRNPMYVALVLIQIGVALTLDNLWILATLPAAVLVMHYGVIAREEAYLLRKFGVGYAEYLASVRRWL